MAKPLATAATLLIHSLTIFAPYKPSKCKPNQKPFTREEQFNDFEFTNSEYPYCYFEYFRSYDLLFYYREPQALLAKYAGTFSMVIYMNDSTTRQLKRKRNHFRSYYHNSRQKALERLIEKSFDIIEHLIRGWEMPEKKRSN